ncbi:MAG: sigma-70 family RNA polymerase sigma factor [Chloroflexaceae bacterium]|nr:sigma-70 family RNA polymerase sigma factor [Chloroflexaceae bacterium]
MAEADEERCLIEAGQKGDIAAFNQLVLNYQGRVYQVCYRMLGDAEGAADATQDTFFSVFRNLGRFRGGSFRAWVLRIATNTCYDVLRARKRRPTTSLDAALEADEAGRSLDPPDPGEPPDETVLRRELGAAIQRGLAELPDDQRLVIVLSDIQGLSYQEIAHITEANLGTVKSRLSRGRARLRDILKEMELLPSRYRHHGE